MMRAGGGLPPKSAARFLFSLHYKGRHMSHSFHLIATQRFEASGNVYSPGETVAEIDSNLSPGELSSLMRTGDKIFVSDQSIPTPEIQPAPEAEPEADVPEKWIDPNPAADQPEAQPETETVAAPDPADVFLTTILDDNTIELLATIEPPIETVADLADWIAAGNRPSQINGLGPKTEKKVLELTGLSLG